ncbi:iron deficiency-induced protein A [Skermanella stibiiresistens SB22]|uniref:Iron deficiency-induced protein A n=1 Tax=Skermanella stibiiresistens SB22 TaxID=1385369 RepID=W9GXJ3_9PROT|nr:Fe(3+) ABC transporter substrate-binding protein [Skermanella stibiiresistens]EWY37361.1 iron deficiency-induced protein A [Skermanella stibiiresistens SB22]
MNIFARGSLAATFGAVMLGTAFGALAADVNVYSSRHYDTDKALYSNFTQQTGIKVNIIEGRDDELIERIRTEGSNSPADILVTVDAGRLWRAQEADILQPTKSKILEETVPAHLREPNGLWFGLTKRARVIIYNKAAVKPSELSTYEDLADPKWKGRVLIRSSTNVYNQSLAGSILAADGEKATEDWARGVVANLARPPQGGDSDQIKAVAAGEGDIAVSNTYYFGRIAGSSKPEDKAVAEKVGVFFPNQNNRGTHVNISGAGILKNAPNRENAVKFLEYLVSPPAQKIFAEGNYEYPVSKQAEISPVIASWGTFKEDELNASVFGKNNEEALKIMDRAGWK